MVCKKNIINRFLALLSFAAMLSLFLTTSKITWIFLAVVFVFGVAVIIFNKTDYKKCGKTIKKFAVGISLFFEVLGIDSFIKMWNPSQKLKSISEMLHISQSILVFCSAIFICVLGFYAAYYLSCGGIDFFCRKFLKFFPINKKDELFANIKRNAFFIISSGFFFLLYLDFKFEWYVSFLIAIILWTVLASQCKSVFSFSSKQNKILKIISLFSSIGVCWYAVLYFLDDEKYEYAPQIIRSLRTVISDITLKIIGVICAVAAVYFAYICILFILTKIINEIKSNKIFINIKSYEIIIYSVLIIGSIVLTAISFCSSQVFFDIEGVKHAGDYIYTSDSPDLVKYRVYINFFHIENDLRQPLFALFSAPFMGLPFFVGRIIGASDCIQAILFNSVQIILLLFSVFLITRIMALTPIKRTCFILVSYSTYTIMLFTLMMEQYIIAFFWLIWALYIISVKKEPNDMYIMGATGTLLTSAVIVPFSVNINPKTGFKDWIIKSLNKFFTFIALMLLLGRFDVFYNMVNKINLYTGYTGKEITISEKLFQFTAFIRNCFIAPKAGVDFTKYTHISWQLSNPEKADMIGICILVVTLISFIINRKKKSSQVAGLWVCWSIVVLFVLGWGTQENGLILYSLYFGWAIMVLLFQLVEKVENLLKIKFLVPVLSVCSVAVLLFYNIPSIAEMLDFAVTYYPR